MDTVPNAAFDANFPLDVEFAHPAGCYLARKLQQSLPAVASAVNDFDNWRDSGWVVTCDVGGQRFEVYFAGIGTESAPTTWMLGVAPVGQPGSIRRLFGAKVAPYETQSKALTLHLHEFLLNDTHISNVRWAMNADPSESKVRDPSQLRWGGANVA
jgi:hypothetical protein